MHIKFRIVEHGVNMSIEKLSYPRVTVEVDPGDPSLSIKNIEVFDDRCSIAELAKSIGEIRCYILRHYRSG